MRLLLQRHDHQSGRASIKELAAERCAGPIGHEWPPLPMRNVSTNTESGATSVARGERSGEMNNRRDFLKAGGALVLGLNLRDSVLAQQPTSAATRSLDLRQVDTW